jgi:phosphatidylethanolamine-binding protein (PEBP) family uncharacterized protein
MVTSATPPPYWMASISTSFTATMNARAKGRQRSGVCPVAGRSAQTAFVVLVRDPDVRIGAVWLHP